MYPNAINPSQQQNILSLIKYLEPYSDLFVMIVLQLNELHRPLKVIQIFRSDCLSIRNIKICVVSAAQDMDLIRSLIKRICYRAQTNGLPQIFNSKLFHDILRMCTDSVKSKFSFFFLQFGIYHMRILKEYQSRSKFTQNPTAHEFKHSSKKLPSHLYNYNKLILSSRQIPKQLKRLLIYLFSFEFQDQLSLQLIVTNGFIIFHHFSQLGTLHRAYHEETWSLHYASEPGHSQNQQIVFRRDAKINGGTRFQQLLPHQKYNSPLQFKLQMIVVLFYFLILKLPSLEKRKECQKNTLNKLKMIYCLSCQIFMNLIQIREQSYYEFVNIYLKSIGRTVLRLNARNVSFRFCSKDNWRDRDEASQKVYITEHEKDTLKKLLKKVEQDEQNHVANNVQFESQLKEILKKHQVRNQAFFSEVSNLHKMLAG